MGKIRKKIEYYDTDYNGYSESEVLKNLYVIENASNDMTTVYNENGDILLCFSNVVSQGFDMGWALSQILTENPSDDNFVKYMTLEDLKKIYK